MPKSFSETERGLDRVGHVLDAMTQIQTLLDGVAFEDVERDPIRRAAIERFMEIISEASRHIPDAWRKQDGIGIPWRSIADLGNVIRHVYMNVDLSVLWAIYEKDFGPLRQALEAMIARHGP